MDDGSDREDDGNSGSASIDYHTLNPGAAKLAADEGAYLGPIHDHDDHDKQIELAEWIGGILGEYLSPETLFDDMCTGVRLLYLAKSIQLIKCAHLKDSEYKDSMRNLQPDEFVFTDHGPPKRASLIAKQRSNITKFLEWCRHIGVPYITLFETDDLTHQKNLRQVTTCLFYVSRISSRFGIEPPSSVKKEMELEEAKLLRQQITKEGDYDGISTDTNKLIFDKPTIFEHEDEYQVTSEIQDFAMISEKYERTSTPSSTHSFMKEMQVDSNIKPISPMRLDFEDEGADAVVVETLGTAEKLHFETKPMIEDVEIQETKDMVIVSEVHFRPVDVPVDPEITKLNDGTEVRVIPAALDLNENTDAMLSDSTYTATTEENEYHTARAVTPDDITGLMYRTAFVDDVSDDDEELENIPHNVESYETMDEPVDVSEPVMSSFEEIPDINDVVATSPFNLYRVPADIVVEKHHDTESSCDESATDVESYVSTDLGRDIRYVEVGVGTEEKYFEQLKPVEKEIMIDFPPYFEFLTKAEYPIIPHREYIVAPVGNEPVYAESKKSRRREMREAHTNTAFEGDYHSRPSRDYNSLEPRQPRRQRQQPGTSATLPTPHARNLLDPENEKGTQTHVSFTQDIIRIINEMGDVPKIQTGSSSASSVVATTPPGSRAGNTVIVRTQYQRNLPTNDRIIAMTQASDLESSRPPRWGSVTSSTRIRSHDPETASNIANKEVRRSIIRRASSLISEQFEKAAVVAKKYQKQIIVVAILIIIAACALGVMLAIFPTT